MAIKGIVCIGANGVMGKDGTMPWGDKPLDGAHVRRLTEGHMVVMGSNTFRSMNYTPLPHRINVVMSKRLQVLQRPAEGGTLHSAMSVDEVMYLANQQYPDVDVWVIGGAQVFEAFLPYIEELYVTTVGDTFEGDTYFPDIHTDYTWEHELLDVHRIVLADLPPIRAVVFDQSEGVTRPETIKTTEYMLHFRKFTKTVTGNRRAMYIEPTQ